MTATNLATQISKEISTDKDGFYEILSLPIGSYEVKVEVAGFRQEVFQRQSLQINQSLRLDAKLVIGQQVERVEVTDQAANVETVNQTIGGSIVGETIQRAPLNGRNVLDLAKLQPGVAETNSDNSSAGTYSIAGGRTDSITFLLDGALNNNLLTNGVVYNPNPDTIAEFRILESNYSAEYGRNGGVVVRVVTKSGTNDWHGSAFEFLRNDALNANSFFNNENGLPRDSGGWDMPWDRAFHNAPKRLTQGWSLFPIVTWRSGFPFDVFARLGDRFDPGAKGPSGAGDPTNVHANIVGPTDTSDPRNSKTFNGSTGNYYFNPNSFSNAQCDPSVACTPGPTIVPCNEQIVADPSLATYGTLPRNYFRGPGYINFDLAFSKKTALIGERTKLEFRAEFFNIFNHANFQNPRWNRGNQYQQFSIWTDSTGVGSGATYDPQPRIIQLALRLSF